MARKETAMRILCTAPLIGKLVLVSFLLGLVTGMMLVAWW